MNQPKCACIRSDARDCFLARHPECRRMGDCDGGMYDAAIDEVCECYCHDDDDECFSFEDEYE